MTEITAEERARLRALCEAASLANAGLARIVFGEFYRQEDATRIIESAAKLSIECNGLY